MPKNERIFLTDVFTMLIICIGGESEEKSVGAGMSPFCDDCASASKDPIVGG
jgi:hypothetical protein